MVSTAPLWLCGSFADQQCAVCRIWPGVRQLRPGAGDADGCTDPESSRTDGLDLAQGAGGWLQG